MMSLRRFIVFFGASSLLAGAVSFVLPFFCDVKQVLIRTWYYLIWGQIVLGLRAFYNALRPRFAGKIEWSKILVPLGIGLIFSTIIGFAVEGEFRVLADQTNLLGSALSLHLDRTYQNITEGYFYYDSFHPIVSELDKRPALYPFLISILHDLTGFSASHGFVVNLLVAWAIGTLFFVAITSVTKSKTSGVLALLMLLAIPTFSQVVRSSGFEALNMFFLSSFYWQAYVYLRDPDEDKLELILYLVLGSALCRYESIVLTVPALLTVLWGLKGIRWSRGSLRMMVIPLWFIPLNWQISLTNAINPGDDPDGSPFGPHYLGKNLRRFFEFLWDPWFKGFPGSPAIATLAVIGLAFLFRHLQSGGMSLHTKRICLIVGTGTLLIVGVQCSYYMGDVTQVYQHRLMASHAPVLTFLALYGIVQGERKISHRYDTKWILIAIFIVVALNGLREAQIAYQGRWLTLFREYKVSLSYLLKEPKAGTLLISDRPGMFTVHGYGAISFQTASEKMGSLAEDMRRKLYVNVLVEQQVPYSSPDKPKPDLKLAPGYSLVPVFELQNDADYYVRISKIIAKSLPEAPSEVPLVAPHIKGKPGKKPKKAKEEALPKKGALAPSKQPPKVQISAPTQAALLP